MYRLLRSAIIRFRPKPYKIIMATRDVKILAKKIGVSILVYAIPLAILGGGLLLIKLLLIK